MKRIRTRIPLRKRGRLTATIVLSALASVGLLAAPAQAAVLCANVAGARACGDPVFHDQRSFTIRNLTLEDTAADGKMVYVRIGGQVAGGWGRETYYYDTIRATGPNPVKAFIGNVWGAYDPKIHKVWIQVCRDEVFWDTCNVSPFQANPFAP
jgi:hypothetical protein